MPPIPMEPLRRADPRAEPADQSRSEAVVPEAVVPEALVPEARIPEPPARIVPAHVTPPEARAATAPRVPPRASGSSPQSSGPTTPQSSGPMPRPSAPMPSPRSVPDEAAPDHVEEAATDRGPAAGSTATGPQLRRFIKSRAYVPMHELRRRFLINGGDDDVTPVDLADRRRVFVGLPEREGRLLGELLRGGDIGYELSLDPISPIVVGVYPMRPVTRA
ncbi:MAG TPA: hypothetical protein VFI15_05050 [Candidatus Limnocylindrales bacterium]|nr:hypothetical protein [Candidatus Limnocylindrales bacterium]